MKTWKSFAVALIGLAMLVAAFAASPRSAPSSVSTTAHSGMQSQASSGDLVVMDVTRPGSSVISNAVYDFERKTVSVVTFGGETAGVTIKVYSYLKPGSGQ